MVLMTGATAADPSARATARYIQCCIHGAPYAFSPPLGQPVNIPVHCLQFAHDDDTEMVSKLTAALGRTFNHVV